MLNFNTNSSLDDDLLLLFPLPRKYLLLLDTFKKLDDIVSFRFNRGEVIRVKDLKNPVQRASGRNFGKKELKQIKAVLKSAYIFEWDKKLRCNNDLELTLKLNLTDRCGVTNKMTPGLRTQRSKMFHNRLMDLIKIHHEKFLNSLGIEVKSNIQRWHENFNIDDCPDIEEGKFPPYPGAEVKVTAADLLKVTFKTENTRIQEAVKRFEEKKSEEKVNSSSFTTTGSTAKLDKRLEGLSEKFKQKLLEKEKAKAIKLMQETPGRVKERNMLKELLDYGPRIINWHKSECHRLGRMALVADELRGRYEAKQGSDGRKTAKQIEVLTAKLAEVMPEIIEFRVVRNVKYLETVKGADLGRNTIVGRIEAFIKEFDADSK